MTTWLIAGKLVETVNQKSGQAFRSLSSFGFSALWPATDTKGLFTWRWGPQIGEVIGSLGNKHGDGYENVTLKVKSRCF